MGYGEFVHGEFIAQELEFSKVYHYIDRYRSPEMYHTKRSAGNPAVAEDRTIWVMWMQGIEDAPELVKKCYESILRNKPADFRIVLLTMENIFEYIELPDYILEKYHKGMITATHLSDIIRLDLLSVYGGCWIDATVFCGRRIPSYMLSDMFLFKLESVMTDPVIKMSSWWLAARKGNRIINAAKYMLDEYWKNETELCNYFLLHIVMSKVIDEDSFCQAIFRDIPFFNSRNAHVLQGKLEMQYCETDWRIMRESSFVQKLTHKRRYLKGDGYNFYMALLDGKLDGSSICDEK